MTITTEMKTALDLIENTKQPVYITGKAGTGKTTLLRYIVSSIKKDSSLLHRPESRLSMLVV